MARARSCGALQSRQGLRKRQSLFRIVMTHLLAALAHDPLSVVLSHLPVPFRLRVASRVCKLWRRIIFRDLHSLKLCPSSGSSKDLRPFDFNSAISLFPSLLRLSIRIRSYRTTGDTYVCLPSSLTSLSVRVKALLLRVHVSEPCPSLKKLSIHAQDEDSELLLPLLRASTSTLSALRVILMEEGFSSKSRKQMPVLLSSLHLPCLTSLSLGASSLTRVVELRHLLRNHATQLYHLELSPCLSVGTFIEGLGELPHLTSLACTVSNAVDLRFLIARSPRLTTLSLNLVTRRLTDLLTSDLRQLIAPTLTRLSVTSLARDFHASLQQFSRLESLFFSASDHYMDLTPYVIGQRHALLFHAFEVDSPRMHLVWPLLSSCSYITKLSFRCNSVNLSASELPTGICFPFLRKLSFIDAAPLELVARFRRVAPRLDRLTSTHVHVGITLQMLKAMCAACHGMSRLRLLVRSDIDTASRSYIATLCLCVSIVVFE